VNLEFGHIQQREDHWAIRDLKGKAGHTRTVPMPGWVKALLDEWVQAASLGTGRLFRRVNKNGTSWGDGLTEKAVWHVVREYDRRAGIERLAPHDLRRTCARLCHAAGGELEQIQFLPGARLNSNDRAILGCKQRIRAAVNAGSASNPRAKGPATASEWPITPLGTTGSTQAALLVGRPVITSYRQRRVGWFGRPMTISLPRPAFGEFRPRDFTFSRLRKCTEFAWS
jgi:hypothetical protein